MLCELARHPCAGATLIFYHFNFSVCAAEGSPRSVKNDETSVCAEKGSILVEISGNVTFTVN